MRFRSVFIKRFRIKLIIFLTLMSISVVILILLFKGKDIPVFNSDTENTEYEILNEDIPNRESLYDISQIVTKLLGFDLKKPETVVAKFSSVFAEATSENNEDEKEEEQEPDITEAPKAEAEDISYPSRERIFNSEELEINNATAYNVNLKDLCAKELLFSVEKNSDEPQILIVHTHTTECYDGDAMNGETERNTDEEKNVVAVGKAMAEIFEKNGILCIHDKTVHDYPSYQGAYTRELSTVNYNLTKYPSIKLVIDVHRDAYIYSDGSKLTVKYDRNGVSTAKAMLVIGTDSLGLEHPDWRENLSLAAKIQNAANIMYPGMMRPINLRRERFNMHTSNGSILIEIGSNGNTLDEAREGGKNIANAVSAVLLAE